MNGATEDDWAGVPEELVFNPGQQSMSFMVMAYDDTIEDDGEMVKLGFGALPAGVVFGSPSTAIVELMNTETLCDNHANKLIVLDSIGSIGQPGERDFWTVPLDPYRVYIIEAIGANDGRDLLDEDSYPGDLTLADPDLIAIWNEDRSVQQQVFSPAVHDLGYGGNSLALERKSFPGLVQIEVAAGDGGTGTYQLKIRVNNICSVVDGRVIYPWGGGPEGYVFDEAADTSTQDSLGTAPTAPRNPLTHNGFLGDNWGSERDEDWYRIELDRRYEYTMELWAGTSEPVRDQATQLKILGIFDQNGTPIAGTASPGSGRRVGIVFQPDSTGVYYISVGSEGTDQTGVYKISVIGEEV